MVMSSKNFSIYVASLPDYNAGILYGSWINLEDCEDLEDLQNCVFNILAESPTAKKEGRKTAEEFAIHDFEGFPEGIISENSSLSEVWQIYEEFMQAKEEDNLEAFEVYASEFDDINYQNFLDKYCGCFESEEDFAESLLQETGLFKDIDPVLERYFDYEAYARDLFMGDYAFISGYVFSSY